MKTKHRWTGLIFSAAISAALFLTGCAHLFDGYAPARQNASVVDYLFPKGTSQAVEPSIPVLNLPVDVGIAFVPETVGNDFSPKRFLSEERKITLLRDVADQFREYKFVRRIEMIPTNYLRPGGSFENLDQVARMFGVQVVALVSYDQMQFTDHDFISIAYWTIVGAYVVEGEKNDTQTMLDAVVYDVASRKMLFRAPGVSRIKARTTPVNADEELRHDADVGYQQAATNLVANLKTELAGFQERVRKNPEEVKIVKRPGYVGVGGFGFTEALALLLLGGATFFVESKTRK